MKKHWSGRRALASLGAVAVLGLLITGCGDKKKESSNSTTASSTVAAPTFAAGTTMDRLQKAGKITVGVKFDQPGFGQTNPTTNKPEGFDIEIAKLMAQGIFGGTKDEAANKITFIESKSKDREPFIQQDKADIIIATYTINDTRKKVVDFAGPYYTAHGGILTLSSDTSIKSITDLNGKPVCVVQGSTYPATLTAKAPQAQQTALSDYSSCEQAVKDKRVVAMATDDVILAGLAQKSGGTEKLINAPYTDEPYGIGLKLGDDSFRTFLNDRLQKIYDNGDWKTAFESTLGKIGLPTPTSTPTIDRYTSAGAGAASSTTTSTTMAK